jgi:hypothetical protein
MPDDDWYDLEDDIHHYCSDDEDENNIIFQEEVDRLDYNPYNIEDE